MSLPDIFQQVCATNGWTISANEAEVNLEGGRKQTVIIDVFSHENEDMVRAFSRIGPSGGLSPTRLRSALGLNFGLPHGALAISGDHLVMADTFLVKDADIGEVESSLRFLAATADRYEKLIYGGDDH